MHFTPYQLDQAKIAGLDIPVGPGGCGPTDAALAALTAVVAAQGGTIAALSAAIVTLQNDQPRWNKQALANGAESGTVAVALPWVPLVVMAWVERPAGGLNIQAMVNKETVGAGGFDFELTGMTDSADYVLAWVAFKT